MKKITTITLLMLFTAMVVLADDKLTGTPIGSTPSVDYTNGQPTTVRNTYADAFDGSLDTLPTFLRHFLVGELSGNTDTYWSTYMYKHRDDPLFYTGPVWDFDIAFDNDYRTYPINSNGDYVYRTTGSCAGNMRYFVNRIINDEAVKKQLLAVWDSVRQAGLTESMIDEYITQMATKLDQSQQLNFMRWPILNNFVHQNPMVWGSYEAEVDNVRRFMRERIEWMDNKLGYEYVPNAISTITSSTDNSQQVYSLQGVSYGSSLETLPAGVYIVKQGQTIKKIRKK